MGDALTKSGITPEQRQRVKDNAGQQRTFAELQYLKDSYNLQKEWQEKNLQSQIDYNREYGSFKEKRLAIAQNYALKIAKAETDGERKKLAKDREKELQTLGFEEFRKGIDFDKVFGNPDKLSTNMLDRLQAKLAAYKATLKIGVNISPESYKEIQDAVSKLEEKIADRSPVRLLKAGYNEYRRALDNVSQAEKDLKEIQKGREVVISWHMDKNGKLVKQLKTQQQAEKDLADAENDRYAALVKMTQSVNSLGEKGLSIVNAGNDLVDMLSGLGVEIPEAVQGTLEGLGTISSSLGSIDFSKPFSILTGVTGTLKGIGQTIGSIFGLSGESDSTSRYEALKEQLEAINAVYDKIIDKSKEDIVFGGGFESVKAASTALDNYYKKVDNLQKIADASGRAGASWKHHSAEWHSNKNVGSDNFAQMGDLIGKSVRSMDDLYYLSGDELYLIMTQMPEAWGRIDSRIRENLESIVDCKDEAIGLKDALDEAVTGVSYDGFYNGFIDRLSDMETSYEDMCDNFEEYLRKSMMAGLVAGQYKDQIRKLYDSWVDAGTDQEYTLREIEDLRNARDELLNSMIAERDKQAEIFGWSASSSSQSGRAGAVTAITEETGRKIEGSLNVMTDYMIEISRLIEELKKGREADSAVFAEIAENTAYCKMLEPLLDIMQRWESNRFKITM